jgi:hypothetical protein
LAVTENVSGGSREHGCQKVASEIFFSFYGLSDARVAEARPPSAESKITTTPATGDSEVDCSPQARSRSSLAKSRFSRACVSATIHEHRKVLVFPPMAISIGIIYIS